MKVFVLNNISTSVVARPHLSYGKDHREFNYKQISNALQNKKQRNLILKFVALAVPPHNFRCHKNSVTDKNVGWKRVAAILFHLIFKNFFCKFELENSDVDCL